MMDKSYGRIESKLDEFQATLKAIKPAKNWKEYLDQVEMSKELKDKILKSPTKYYCELIKLC